MVWTISRKLSAIIVTAVVLSVVAMGIQLYTLYNSIYAERQKLIRSQVESAISVLAHYEDKAKAGEMTLEEAQERAREATRPIRFGEGDYVFMYDPKGIRMMHPDVSLEGKSAWDTKDSRGTYQVREMLERAGEGGGYTTYYRPRLKGGDEIPKLTYSQTFTPWNWTVAGGLYIDDLTATFRSAALKAALAGLIFCLILVGCAIPLARSISRPLATITAAMRRLASGDKTAALDIGDRRDEIGQMAEAFASFRQAAIERDQLEAEAAVARNSESLAKERQAAIETAKAEDLRVLVGAVETSFDRLSIGDLTVRMNQKVAPEFLPIQTKFNASVSQLEEAIGGVVSSVQTIRTGLSEIAVASNDLSQRTEQQAASIEETVAALSEVSQTVATTAENAGRARESARMAATKAEEGGAIVGRAVSAMEEIEGSSQKINDIIGVIDEIAFQTNLLALNAGVEAARAGEAGKGFAVVAQEVRELAQRSATAAKEIKELISTSREKVGTGVDLVTASGRSLDEIVAQVNAMSNIISTIAESATEQASSLREVSGAADQMDKVTQQNAAMVEETTAATRNVEIETDALATSVSRFAVSGQSAKAGLSTRPASTARPAVKPTSKLAVASAGTGRTPVASPVHAMQDRLAKGTAPKRATPAISGTNALARKDEDWTEF